jgi:hypothetical protein
MISRQQEEALFEAARQLADPAARRAFLDAACAGQPALRKQLDSLLAAETEADSFFQRAETAPRQLVQRLGTEGGPPDSENSGDADASMEGLGDHIGPYKLLQKIGEGGCGVVFMAEQEKPIRRRVALKIIKLGMDTKNVIARFNAERQALAMMDHLNIARVFDAGATDTGRPYFVMELVRGTRVTAYCDQNNLDTQRRLELFIQICQAIQHAHQKGVIHRDIKPSNILVTMHDGVPVPKVIDFGIAKAIEGRLTDQTLFTGYEQLIGTPAYMSPEQAEMSGLDVDTRSDIYSLGVLLYELLTGRPPFDPKELVKSGLDEMRRTLREREPQRPSNVLTTLHGTELTATAAHRHAEPPKLISLLKGDLDWIVMKALEKDRTRRYETANGLAADLRRYLSDEPVAARPPSRLYRLGKLVRRNQVVFLAGAAVAVTLVAGMTATTWMLLQERAARQRAVAAEQRESDLRQQAERREKITQLTLLISQERFPEADELAGHLTFDKATLEGAAALRSLGEWHALDCRWRQAEERFTQLLRVDEFDGWDVATLDYLECGPCFIELDDQAGYEHFRRAAIARYAGTTCPAADRILKISLLLPAGAEILTSLEPVAATTLQTVDDNDNRVPPDHFRAAWQCVSLALLEYRRGNFQLAANWCRRCLAYQEVVAPRAATARIILAMADWKLGNPAAAREELATARAVVAAPFKEGLRRGSPPNGFWFDWVFARILVREAEGVVVDVPAYRAE